MRKHIILFAFLAVVLALTSSCAALHTLYPFPYGKWENAELGLVLDINPETELEAKYSNSREFPGSLLEDDERIDVFIVFAMVHGTFDIFRESDRQIFEQLYDEASREEQRKVVLFDGGYYRANRGKLRLGRLRESTQERVGSDTIIFDLIEEDDGTA